jgi:hypothetical protein
MPSVSQGYETDAAIDKRLDTAVKALQIFFKYPAPSDCLVCLVIGQKSFLKRVLHRVGVNASAV